ncbi:MAG: PAS domain S-box protein [Spirochaetota bacterium]
MSDSVLISSDSIEEYVEHRKDFLVVTDRNLIILHANRWFCQLAQMDIHSLRGQNLSAVLPASWCERFSYSVGILKNRSHVHLDDLRDFSGKLIIQTSADIFRNEKSKKDSVLIIIQNHRTTRTYLDVLQILQNPSRSFKEKKEYRDALNFIIETAIKISGMDAGGLYVYDNESDAYRLLYSNGLSEPFVKKAEFFSSDTRYYILLQEGEPVVLKYADMNLPPDDFRMKEGLTLTVSIPIKVRGVITGALNIVSHEKKDISDADVISLKAMGEHIAALLDRMRVEYERGATEIRYKDLVENLQEAVYTITSEGVLTYVSPVISSIIGYTVEELTGHHFSEFIHDDDIIKVHESFVRTLNGVYEPSEYRLVTKDGGHRYVRTLTRVVPGSSSMELTGILTDIHDRKMTELALVESEEKFRAVAETTTAAIFLIQDKEFKYVNPAFVDVTGYTFDDVKTEDFWFVVHPDHREIVRQRGQARQRGESVPSRYEFMINHKSGEVRWVDFSATRIVFDNKPAMLGSAFDITERKEYEKQLLSSEEKFYKAFNSNPAAMTLNKFSNGEYIDFNEAAERLAGCTKDEAVGKTIFDLNVFAEEHEYKKFVNMLVQHGQCRDMEYHLRTNDGSIRTGIISAEIFTWNGEKTVITSTVDITDRKEAEQTIREQYEKIQAQYEELEEMAEELETNHHEIMDINNRLFNETEKLETTLRSIADGVITTDLDGNIDMCNRMAVEILQQGADLLNGKNIESVFTLVRDKNGIPVEHMLEPVIKNQEVVSYSDVKLLVDEGTWYDVELVASPITGINTGVTGVVIVIRDVTSRKKMEHELIKSSRIESLGVFAGGIAHDFNNLLTAILGNISLAKMVYPEDEKLHDILADAEKASARAKTLTQQLLTFSRGGAPIKRVISLQSIVKETVAFVLSGSAVSCEYDIDENLRYINADEGQISQVIQNIIINARQATKDTGSIYIEARNEDNTPPSLPDNEGGYVRVSIHDDGPGIKKEIQEKIFDPYFTTRERGSGLGLSVAYSIVNNHGGKITVDSREGSGTTFTLYLPSSAKKTIECEKFKNPVFNGSGRILLMDDETDILSVLSAILQSAGYDVTTTESGEEALSEFFSAQENGNPYDCVVLDLTVPGHRGGADIIDDIREIDPQVKAIVSSGYANNRVMAAHKDFGFDGVLTKPYTHHEVVSLLKDVME